LGGGLGVGCCLARVHDFLPPLILCAAIARSAHARRKSIALAGEHHGQPVAIAF